MKRALAIFFLSSCTVLQGCWVLSLNDWSKGSEATPDPALVGSWQTTGTCDDGTQEGNCSMEVTTDGKTFTIRYGSRGGKDHTSFAATEFMLNGQRFVDVQLSDEQPDDDQQEWKGLTLAAAEHLLDGSSVWKVDVKGDELSISSLDDGWAKEQVKQGTLGAPMSVRHDVAVLTGTTEQLREVLARHSNDPAAWRQPMKWKRVSAAK